MMDESSELGTYQNYSFHQVNWSEIASFYEQYRPIIFEQGLQYSPASVMSADEQIASERLSKNMGQPYRLNVGIYFQDDLVGWSYGWQDKAYSYNMTNTGILPAHQNKGIYSHLLRCMLDVLEHEGFQIVHSHHRMTNSQVLVPKLKAGFVITGFELTDVFGPLVCLSWFPNPIRRKMLGFWSGEQRPDEQIKQLLNL